MGLCVHIMCACEQESTAIKIFTIHFLWSLYSGLVVSLIHFTHNNLTQDRYLLSSFYSFGI